MNGVKTQHNCTSFLGFYSEQNSGRPTRIGVFETIDGTTNDYWLENGLPFKGIDTDFSHGITVVEIILEGMTHVIRNVRKLSPIYSLDGGEEGMDIIATDGTTTILRYEDS
ncbi:MAG: hypothetical protein AAB288_11130 [Acidobacteriota bacterium]